jgi:L-asparaginase II
MTFTRSALKPFQALPFLLDGGADRFGLSNAELALLCASHSAEEKHVRTVQSILGKICLDESHLECGCHAPLYYDSVGLPAPQDRSWSPLHHNCSGKHSGFLAWCRLHDVPSAGYIDPAHPLQQAIRSRLGQLAATPGDDLPSGMDGCSAPNYAMPLSRLAHMFARLAQGKSDPEYGGAMGDLFNAMTGHPDLVSGQARCDLAYMSAGAGDWVAKVGADAVQTIGVRSAGLGIAIKIADGAKHSLQTATYSVLDQLGLLGDEQRSLLEHYRQPALKNARGTVVGNIRSVLRLRRI